MAIKKTSREEILKHSIKLFKINGYYNTSMANIADACGLIKGSIYHHFKSKEEIGLESLKTINNYFIENIYSIVYDETMSIEKRVVLFIKENDEYFLHSEGGCLLGNFALEVSNENVAFKEEIRDYFSKWELALAHLFEQKFDKTSALELAQEFVALTQGEIMMMNLYNERVRYLRVGKKIIALFE